MKISGEKYKKFLNPNKKHDNEVAKAPLKKVISKLPVSQKLKRMQRKDLERQNNHNSQSVSLKQFLKTPFISFFKKFS